MLLCLNSEWQGCESPELARGSRLVASEIFGDRPYVEFEAPQCDDLSARDGVFALDCVARRFRSVLSMLEDVAPERVFTVGGTCGSEAAPVAYLADHHDDFGVLWLDAHGDLNTPASSPSAHFHGMVLRTLLGDGPEGVVEYVRAPLDPRKVVVVDARDLDAAEREYADGVGVGLIGGWPDDVSAIVSARLREAGVKRLYVHLDVDVFDPAAYGDALFSVPGGPSLGSVSSAVRPLAESFDVVGVGVVESCGRDSGAVRVLRQFLVDSGLWQ